MYLLLPLFLQLGNFLVVEILSLQCTSRIWKNMMEKTGWERLFPVKKTNMRRKEVQTVPHVLVANNLQTSHVVQ